MNRGATIFLQAVIVLIGIGALVFMLWEPHLEGRNAQATPFEIYFNDPFLAYAYIASLAFFVALYQTFRVLGYIRENKAFSQATGTALRTIKRCAIILIVSIGAPVAYLFIVRPDDDIAGGVALGLVMIFVSVVVATTAGMLERIARDAVESKFDSL